MEEEEERKILLEIDGLHEKLLQESTSRWNGMYSEEPSGYNYKFNADELLKKVYELHEKFNPEYLTRHCIEAFSHTCNKEVSCVEYHHEKAIKRNAPKIRKVELVQAINKANIQIRLDLFTLFLKVSEIKSVPVTFLESNEQEIN
jgi:hypothetical protein